MVNASRGQTHPGPAMSELPAAIREQIVARARAEYPNEMCGLIIGDADAAVLITREGEGHTGYADSACVQDAVDDYLIELTVPNEGVTCD